MTKFEVGESYALHLPAKYDGKATFITDIYTVTKRTPCYLTFSHISHDGTKMPHCRCKIFTSDSRGEFVHATAFFCLYADSHIDDDSQPEPATADDTTSASNNNNATASQPAIVANPQSETTAQPEPVRFVIGQTFSRDTVVGIQRFIIRGRQSAIVRGVTAYVWFEFFPLTDSRFPRHEKRKIFIGKDKNGVLSEYFCFNNHSHKIFASQFADNHHNENTPISENNSVPQPVSVNFIPGTVYYGNDSGNHFPVKIIARTADSVTTDFIGAYIKNAKIQTIAGVEYAVFPTHYRNIEIWADKIETPEHVQTETNSQPELLATLPPDNLYDDDSFSDAPGDNSCPDMDIPECREPDSIPADNPGFTVVPHDRMHITRPDYTVYPDAIHDDIPCVNVPACVTHTLNPAAVNPLFSLNFFFAHCLFLFRLFCASLHSKLIPYMLRDSFTEFYPSHFKDFYADKNHFPAPFLLPCPRCGSLEKPVFAHRFYFDNVTNNLVEMLIVNCPHCGYTENSTIFSAKQDHSYSCYWGNDTKAAITLAENWNSCGLRERHKRLEAIHICPPRSKYFNHARKLNKMKLDACSDFQSLFSLILTLRAEEILSQATYMRFKLTSSDNAEALARELAHAIIQRREKSKPVHAEINDITPTPEPQPKTRKPESATDIEHKLIDTKDLHFSEKRAALDHNATVISSCMFHEAVVSMLLKISPAAIFQLGFHMGLFIAKPKGKKIAIAEAFAKRLINRRNLHSVKSASVHTRTAQQTSNNTASIPDSVTFFETKHGQLAFVFTNELVFTD